MRKEKQFDIGLRGCISLAAVFNFFRLVWHVFSIAGERSVFSSPLSIWKNSLVFIKCKGLHSACTGKYRSSFEMQLSCSSESEKLFLI